MPRPFFVFALAATLIVLTSLILHSFGVSGIENPIVSALVGAVLLILAARLYPKIIPTDLMPGEFLRGDLVVQQYLRDLVDRFGHLRPAGLASGDPPPRFESVFCELGVYFVDDEQLTLTGWMTTTDIGRSHTGFILTGPPGSGKSVSLQAIALSCAHARFLAGVLPLYVLRRSERRIQNIEWIRRRLGTLFMRSWTVGAPPLIPVLIRLKQCEDELRPLVSSSQERRSWEEVAKQIVERSGLEYDVFRRSLQSGDVALLFDELDELPTHELRCAALHLLARLAEIGDQDANLFMVACRSGTFTGALAAQKPTGFGHTRVDRLSVSDRRLLVEPLVSRQAKRGRQTTGLFAGLEQKLRDPLYGKYKKMPPYRVRAQQLIYDVVSEITEEVPARFKDWRPELHPLSLHRLTKVVVSQPSECLQCIWDMRKNRVRWVIRLSDRGGTLASYAAIILSDVRGLVERRSRFLTLNNVSLERLLALYGELAYDAYATQYVIPGDALIAFVRAKSGVNTGTSDEANLSAFCEPGVVTEADTSAGTYGFRDRESANVLAAAFAAERTQSAERIDAFVTKHGPQLERAEAEWLRLALSRLEGDELVNFAETCRSFGTKACLTALGSRVAAGGITQSQAAALVARCAFEVVQSSAQESVLLRLWVLTRHMVFKLGVADGLGPKLTDCLYAAITAPNIAASYAVLGLAELIAAREVRADIGSDACSRDDVVSLIESCMASADLPLRVAAQQAAVMFFADVFPELRGIDIAATVVGGQYTIGSHDVDDAPLRPVSLPGFRFARYPLTTFEYLRNSPSKAQGALLSGRALCPIVGVTWDEARSFAKAQGARLPRRIEYEIVATHGAAPRQDRRRYPWGDVFPADRRDLAYHESFFRQILGDTSDAVVIGLKPGLGTPEGVYDLCGNVWQLTEDRAISPTNPTSTDEAEVLVFGPSSATGVEEALFRGSDFSHVLASHGHAGVGMRLCWDA